MQTTKGETKMVAPNKVKIRMIRDARIPVNDPNSTKVVKAGEVIEVDEADAAELCDRTFDGPTQFRGERDTDATTKYRIVRAERVQ